MANNSTYAIDFGTSNTAIARWNVATERSEIVKLPGCSQQLVNLPPLIPSLLYVEDASQGKVVMGQQVRDRGWDLANDPRFFRSFKRGIGTEIQGFLPELEGQTLSFERVGEWYLRELITNLQADSNEQKRNRYSSKRDEIVTAVASNIATMQYCNTAICIAIQ